MSSNRREPDPAPGRRQRPAFTPDGKTIFISIQHPGELRLTDGEDATGVAEAGTAWPDFRDGIPARPSLVAIRRENQGTIGS